MACVLFNLFLEKVSAQKVAHNLEAGTAHGKKRSHSAYSVNPLRDDGAGVAAAEPWVEFVGRVP